MILGSIIPAIWGAASAAFAVLFGTTTDDQHLQTVYLLFAIAALVIGAVWRVAARFSKIESRLSGFDMYMRMTTEVAKDTNRKLGGDPDQLVRDVLESSDGVHDRRHHG